MIWDKTYINLEKEWTWFKGSSNWMYFKLIPTRENYQVQWTLYWLLIFTSEQKFNKSLSWDRDVKADYIVWIKEKIFNDKPFLSWIWINDDTQVTQYVNLYDNDTKWMSPQFEKKIVLKQVEYKQRKQEVDEEF